MLFNIYELLLFKLLVHLIIGPSQLIFNNYFISNYYTFIIYIIQTFIQVSCQQLIIYYIYYINLKLQY